MGGIVAPVEAPILRPAAPSPTYDSEQEIMVQFPPWIPADPMTAADSATATEDVDAMLIPAPPHFATVTTATVPQETVAEPTKEESPQMEQTQRRRRSEQQLRNKSFSETITSVDDSDDSEAERFRMTEHETSLSGSEPLSPVSPSIQSPQSASVEAIPVDGSGSMSSEAFLTALSQQVTLTGSVAASPTEAFGTALEFRTSRSATGGSQDTSRNSTLRSVAAELSEAAAVGETLRSPVTGATASAAEAMKMSSPDVTEDVLVESSTSGSYSLVESQDALEPQCAVITAPAFESPEVKEKTVAPVRGTEQRSRLKESMKLEFSHDGCTGAPATTKSQSRTRRHAERKRGGVAECGAQLTSSEEDDDPSNSERSHAVRKRRSRNMDAQPPAPPARCSSSSNEAQKKSRSQSPSRSRDKATRNGVKGDWQHASVLSPGMVRSPAMHEGFRPEDWILNR